MCGLSGVVLPPGTTFGSDILNTLACAQQHRGPDDQGFLTWNPDSGCHISRDLPSGGARVGITHQRLSILDLSTAGWQPMTSGDGRWALALNGEIYNYVELRAELAATGVQFKSASDTEVLLEGLALWGLEVLPRLVGMFAFAALDLRARELHLVRDHFGIKPLHVATWRGGVAFASEIKALIQIPGVPRRVNAQVAYDYLVSGRTEVAEDSFYRDIQRVPPAHVMSIPLDKPSSATLRRYWQLAADETSELSFPEASTRLQELFLDSVRLHLRSDVKIGAAISGGIDSSAIVSCMRAVGGSSLDINAFSFISEEPATNEERWVDIVASATGANIHKIHIRPGDLLADVDELVTTQDEPFGSTSIYAQYRVFGRARDEGVIVMLDGQGADEMMAGYHSYLDIVAKSMMRSRDLGGLLRLKRGLRHTGSSVPIAQPILKALARRVPVQVPRGGRSDAGVAGPRWLDAGWCEGRGVTSYAPSPVEDLRAQLRRDTTSGNLRELLRYEDRNSMRFSLESRVPFLTPALAEFVSSLPAHYLIDAGGTTKSVFRAAMKGIVPQPILDRRDKIGYATPEKRWLTQLRPWVDDVLTSATPETVPLLNIPAVSNAWGEVLRGSQPYGWHVWRWLNLIRWAQQNEVTWD